MSWAARRRFLISLIIGAVVVAFLTIVLIATFHKAPSCNDGTQNQGETGIDCGGPCPYLCTAHEEPPTVLFTQVLPSSAGHSAIVASVENKNAQAAAKAVPYTITLYGADHSFIQSVRGAIDLPPSATVPIFVSNIATGNQVVASAFLVIDPDAPLWYRDTGSLLVPTVTGTRLGGSAEAPRIESTLTNPGTAPLSDVSVVVIVHGEGGNIIAASATIVSVIPGGGQATATFTWNEAFSAVPLSIEVVPIMRLP